MNVLYFCIPHVDIWLGFINASKSILSLSMIILLAVIVFFHFSHIMYILCGKLTFRNELYVGLSFLCDLNGYE